MTNDFRVEKREEQIRLFMADGFELSATVFLAQYAMFHSGEQTVLDLLLEEDPFLPAKSTDGEFHLIRKRMLSHVCCPVVLDDALGYSERNVRICFPGGVELQGIVKMDLPSHAARLTDYINGGSEFFPLFAEGESYLVNRHLVRNIVLID
ncbi:hypothetical protein SAMN02745165_02224 [Malonomonas rubra DSM 5091]|uniref:Uncharacterized protein n=1 Tax=Malonomonas rubra DSM 5091 TaxID=1122189 RepID=A0A1M6IS29_MALRU|nr:hypothetical protein [Malonomonas rubra]SHJ37293.1 hypothetical protein SAMN02745165_02224 [Malonomonas rubra DSM 5091]